MVEQFVDVLSVTAKKLQHFTKGRGWTDQPKDKGKSKGKPGKSSGGKKGKGKKGKRDSSGRFQSSGGKSSAGAPPGGKAPFQSSAPFKARPEQPYRKPWDADFVTTGREFNAFIADTVSMSELDDAVCTTCSQTR